MRSPRGSSSKTMTRTGENQRKERERGAGESWRERKKEGNQANTWRFDSLSFRFE
jgi:hypothetical protein